MKAPSRQEPRIAAAAEKRMRDWALAEEVADRLLRFEQGHRPAPGLGEYITISREAGAGAESVARLVGQRLDWQVLDKQLLETIAERCRVSRSTVELMDERRSNWVHDVLGSWWDSSLVPHDKYFMALAGAVVAAAKRGRVVVVGRGANFLLPPDRGLAVRLVAPEPHRVRRVMEQQRVDEGRARQLVRQWDRERQAFVREYFNKDVADSHAYDLTVNVARWTAEATAELIVAAYRLKTAQPAP